MPALFVAMIERTQPYEKRRYALASPLLAKIDLAVLKGGVRVMLAGAQGFERIVRFAIDEQSLEITRRVRETLED